MAKAKVKETVGRPTLYSDKLADKICLAISTSRNGIHTICKEDGMPCPATVFNWLANPEYKSFLDKYTRARECQAEMLVEEIISIADDATKDDKQQGDTILTDHEHINRSRLRVDARKWAASKLFPKRYGDKMDITTDGEKLGQKNSIIKLPDGTEIPV